MASHMNTLQCVIFKNEAALYWKKKKKKNQDVLKYAIKTT